MLLERLIHNANAHLLAVYYTCRYNISEMIWRLRRDSSEHCLDQIICEMKNTLQGETRYYKKTNVDE